MLPELLLPAGSRKMMDYAFAYGADAVYVGQPRYSLRVRNNEFNRLENLAEAADKARAMDKQFYLACNISPHNDKVRSFLRDMEEVLAIKPDAVIMSDPGLIMMVRERWPDQAIHLSVQANAVNYATVKFWQQQGIERVILSRELSIEEIEDIRKHCPDMELEVFVHGALCMAYSGRCLLSGYMTHRDSNQGACTNSCRWKYQVHEAKENESGDIFPDNTAKGCSHESSTEDCAAELAKQEAVQSSVFLLQEKGRPDQYMPAFEDEHGTYIMNSKDLRAVQHVKRLSDMGIASLKIEGRTKSHFYVARTAQVYRRAIDEAAAGKPFDFKLMDELDSLASRGYTEGFYRRHVPSEYQNYEMGNSIGRKQQFVGEVIESSGPSDRLKIEVKNHFELGDELELMTPEGNVTLKAEVLENLKGELIKVAPGSGHQVVLQLPMKINPEYALLMKTL
ncbi:MAG: tRNA 5-hydroxyuridine modification protein YegQ [Gammaproteobacteria bacterium]|nr:tRNA 5-hydroxyuridine modification protein YegQ [Gammaproteobacteria bacterium]